MILNNDVMRDENRERKNDIKIEYENDKNNDKSIIFSLT